MKLLEQQSDKQWRISHGDTLVRNHRLKLVEAIGDFSPQMLLDLNSVANDDSYGGIKPGYLFVEKCSCFRCDDRWDIDIVLCESTVSRLEPVKVIDSASGEIHSLDRPLYSARRFSDWLPTPKPFPCVAA